jgi:hypothetical protein
VSYFLRKFVFLDIFCINFAFTGSGFVYILLKFTVLKQSNRSFKKEKNHQLKKRYRYFHKLLIQQKYEWSELGTVLERLPQPNKNPKIASSVFFPFLGG